MLSLSNFTQRTPISLAVWSLTCFFISASTNRWLKALYPLHQKVSDFNMLPNLRHLQKVQ